MEIATGPWNYARFQMQAGPLAMRRFMSGHPDFSSVDDAKTKIRVAVSYLLKGAAGCDRGDIVRQIIAIVNEEARGLVSGGQDGLDEGMPGG
jgi:hypothetical protein